MDDGLVRVLEKFINSLKNVLILIVVDNGLVHTAETIEEARDKRS